MCGMQVLATGGDPHLGGDDWDAALMQFLDKKCLAPYGVDANDPSIRTNLRGMAEQAKIALSSADQVKVTIPVGGPGSSGSEVVLTQQLLDQLSTDLFRRCRLPVDQACWQAGVDLGTVVERHEKDMQSYNSTKASRRGEKPAVKIVPKRRQPISEACPLY
jgi:molecular chaperone DnaK (HSP70)